MSAMSQVSTVAGAIHADTQSDPVHRPGAQERLLILKDASKASTVTMDEFLGNFDKERDRKTAHPYLIQAVIQDAIRAAFEIPSVSIAPDMTLSIGERPFTRITGPLLELFAAKVGASLHVVDSVTHPSLASHHARLKRTTRFLKLPLLSYYLERYEHVLYLDDDIVLSPATADLFALTPCGMLGAVVKRHKPQAWHAMHWRTACELYGLPDCEPKTKWLFNSGPELLLEPDPGASHHSAFVQASPRLCLHPHSHPNQAAAALAAPPLARRRLAEAQARVPRAVRPALPQRRSTTRAALRARAGASLQLRGQRAAQASRKARRAAPRPPPPASPCAWACVFASPHAC